jgi:hypothetical protein
MAEPTACHASATPLLQMMEASGNNVALVMFYSGHRSLESFKIYLPAPTQGCIATDQRIESGWPILGLFCGNDGNKGNIGNR